MKKDKVIGMDFPDYITHTGYGHMGNLKVFKLKLPIVKNSANLYHANYGNAENTVFDVWGKTRLECLKRLRVVMDEDLGKWQKASRESYLADGKGNIKAIKETE